MKKRFYNYLLSIHKIKDQLQFSLYEKCISDNAVTVEKYHLPHGINFWEESSNGRNFF